MTNAIELPISEFKPELKFEKCSECGSPVNTFGRNLHAIFYFEDRIHVRCINCSFVRVFYKEKTIRRRRCTGAVKDMVIALHNDNPSKRS